MAANVVEITDTTFEEQVTKSDLPVMIDMWAPWCGPCRMVSPTVERLGGENAGKLKTCKMNVDQSPDTAIKFGISAIPTVMFFRDGKEVETLRLIGALPKSAYQYAIDKLLAEDA